MKIKEYLAPMIMLSVLVLGAANESVKNIPHIAEGVQSSFSELMNQYKRRADLVPQLINIVKASTRFEEKMLEMVINARSKVLEVSSKVDFQTKSDAIKKYQQAQNELSVAISKFMLVVENYPAIKSTEGFIALQSQIEGNENRIAIARRDYILSIKNFNIAIRTFPGWLWNKLFFHFAALEYPSESSTVTEVPELRF